MCKGNAIALISRIREKSNRFIVRELEEHGIYRDRPLAWGHPVYSPA